MLLLFLKNYPYHLYAFVTVILPKVVKAKSFPMICMYEDNDLTIPEELQTEVQNMMHRSRIKSSSSETDDADVDMDMTVIRHKSLRRLRHGSDRSYGMIEFFCS